MSRLPVVYINLSKDMERQQRMAAQMQHMGLAGERLPAVWWGDLAPETQARHHSPTLTERQYFKPMGNGEKGCYCSHMTAWSQLLASDAPAMVIFEDDVRFLPRLPQALEAIAQLPSGTWDMVKLLGRADEKIHSRRPLCTGPRGEDVELITYRRVSSFAAGYVVSRSGAEKMLRTRTPFGRPVDVDMRFWFENDLRIFGVHPSVIALDDTSEVSSIWQQREAPMTLGQRLRKLRMKLEFTWGSLRARSPHVSDTL